jgi:hypothetical protein
VADCPDAPWIRLYVRPGHEPPWLVPSPPSRRWFPPDAYRCLPLLVADQFGWSLLSPVRFTAIWDGAPSRTALRIGEGPQRDTRLYLRSIFGHGILSILFPFYVRTSPEVDILVKGPPNTPKDGVSVLEGLVETDWFDGSFTANLRLTRPGQVVQWEPGEPLFQLVPYPRGWLERFRAETVTDGPDHAAFMAAARRWDEDRAIAVDAMWRGQDVTVDGQYRQGRRHDGIPAPPTHRKKLAVPPFPGIEPAPREF